MSSFDVRKHIRERRLKEATEQLRGKQQFSAPPSVFRQSQQQSARSSVIGFDDAASVHVQSETDADWYQDDIPTQEERQRQVYEPKGSAETESARRLGTVIEGIPGVGDFLGESPKKEIPGKVQELRAPKADAGGQMRTSSGRSTSAALERERERVAGLERELAEEREARKNETELRRELRELLRESQRQLAELKAERAAMQGRDLHALASPVAPPSQVITVKTEDKPDSKKLVIPPLTAKSEPELDEWLVKLRTGVQAAAPGSGISMIGKAETVSRMLVEDWRKTASHQRGALTVRDPRYSRLEKQAEEEIGAAVMLKLPVAAQRHAQKQAESMGGPMELHVALSKAFMMIMSTTEAEAEGVVDALKIKRSIPAKQILEHVKQYKLDYEKVIDCGYVKEFENHSKFFNALKHAVFTPPRDASLITAFEIWKRDNPIPAMFTDKEYFDKFMSFITAELHGHQDYGEHQGDHSAGFGEHGSICTHPTCREKEGHTTDQCPTRRWEQSEKDKAIAAQRSARDKALAALTDVSTSTKEPANANNAEMACRMLVNDMTCRFGSECSFSHDPIVVDKFKNKVCPRGPNCRYHAMPNGCAYGIHDRGQARVEDNDEQGLGAGLTLEVLATSGNDPNYLQQDDADEWYIE